MVMAVLALGLCQYRLLFRLELFLDSKTARLSHTDCACYRAMCIKIGFTITVGICNPG